MYPFRMKIFGFLLLLYVSVVLSEEEPEGDLQLVFTIFRHGDRSPINIYPHDTWKESDWNKLGAVGLGELTNLGKHNAFDLGRFFWSRYSKQLNLNSKYIINSPEIHIRSTAIHRTKMSAVYFLAGFYQQNIEDVLKEEDKYVTSYSVYFKSEQEDQLLSMTDCPKSVKLLDEWKSSSPEYQAFLKRNKVLFTLMKTMSGFKDDSQMNTFSDDVYCENSHNLTQPDWIINNIGAINEYFDKSKSFLSPTIKIQKIVSGPLLSKLVNDFDRKVHTNSSDKMFIYSAHDTNVINLLLALGCFNDRQPPYSSAVIIELRKLKKMYYVYILYRNESSNVLHSFKLPGCDNTKCSYSAFRREIKNLLFSTSERESFCGHIYKSQSLRLSDNIIPITVATVVVVCAVLSFIMYRIYKRKRKPRGDPMMYRPLAYGEDDEDM